MSFADSSGDHYPLPPLPPGVVVPESLQGLDELLAQDKDRAYYEGRKDNLFADIDRHLLRIGESSPQWPYALHSYPTEAGSVMVAFRLSYGPYVRTDERIAYITVNNFMNGEVSRGELKVDMINYMVFLDRGRIGSSYSPSWVDPEAQTWQLPWGQGPLLQVDQNDVLQVYTGPDYMSSYPRGTMKEGMPLKQSGLEGQIEKAEELLSWLDYLGAATIDAHVNIDVLREHK